MNYKGCYNCLYQNAKGDDEPCISCKDDNAPLCDHRNWKPKAGNVSPQKARTTKEELQSIAQDVEKIYNRIQRAINNI